MTNRHRSPFDGVEWRVSGTHEFEAFTPEGREIRPNAGKHGYSPADENRTSTDTIAVVECRLPTGSPDSEWSVRIGVAPTSGGAYVVRSILIEPTGTVTPSGGITTDMLRDRGLSPASATSLVASSDLAANNIDASLIRAALSWLESSEQELSHPRAKTGRPRKSDRELAQIALAYLEELPSGPGLLKRLSKRFDDVPESTMRDWIRICRKRKWLSPAAKQGSKAGAAAGTRLTEYLAEREQKS